MFLHVRDRYVARDMAEYLLHAAVLKETRVKRTCQCRVCGL